MLIRDADAAMYRAKEQGRARCELFDAEMRARALRRLEVERELRQGIERDELSLNYQPVVALGSGEITGLEALVRWEHPERGQLDPGRVHPGRRGERADRADRAAGSRRRACRQILEWHEQRPDAAPARRLGQPLGPPGRPPRPRRLGRRDPRPHRPRPRPPAARDHRERPGRGVGHRQGDPGGAQRARRAARPRRLRHRLLLARLPQPLPARRAEDRPLLRRRARRRAGAHRDRRGDHRHGAGPLARRDRRGRRKRGPALGAAPPRLRLRPGPPLLAGAAARRRSPGCSAEGLPRYSGILPGR